MLQFGGVPQVSSLRHVGINNSADRVFVEVLTVGDTDMIETSRACGGACLRA